MESVISFPREGGITGLVLLNCAFFGSERQISICNELPTEVGEVGTMTAF